MERALVEQRLASYAIWYAASHGYSFGDGAKRDIESIASKAVTNIFGDKLPKRIQPRHQSQIMQAEASLALLVSTMIQGSNSIKGYASNNPSEIGEQTLGWAMNRLCPLFPIC